MPAPATKERAATATRNQSTIELASRLFVANWQPDRGYEPSHIAKQCLEAAEEFEEAAKTLPDES